MGDQPPSNVLGVRDVYELLSRVEGKIDTRFEQVDSKVDQVTSRMDKLEGALMMFKWLGPTGVVALVFGIAKATGVL